MLRHSRRLSRQIVEHSAAKTRSTWPMGVATSRQRRSVTAVSVWSGGAPEGKTPVAANLSAASLAFVMARQTACAAAPSLPCCWASQSSRLVAGGRPSVVTVRRTGKTSRGPCMPPRSWMPSVHCLPPVRGPEASGVEPKLQGLQGSRYERVLPSSAQVEAT